MALNLYTRHIPSIGGGVTTDIDIGTKGGIVVSLRLTNHPRTFFDAGTDAELPRQGDIHVLIADSSTSLSLIGQQEVTPVPDAITIPTAGEWNWDHPHADELKESRFVDKLTPNLNFTIQPNAVIRPSGKLRIISAWDVEVMVIHDLGIEAEVLVFD